MHYVLISCYVVTKDLPCSGYYCFNINALRNNSLTLVRTHNKLCHSIIIITIVSRLTLSQLYMEFVQKIIKQTITAKNGTQCMKRLCKSIIMYTSESVCFYTKPDMQLFDTKWKDLKFVLETNLLAMVNMKIEGHFWNMDLNVTVVFLNSLKHWST